MLWKSLLVLLLLAGASPARASDERAAASAVRVRVCDLLRNPAAFNHKRVEVTGHVARGFELFTLSDAPCPGTNGSIWLEFGGRTGSEVTYCCATDDAVRDTPLVVEGVTTTLRKDGMFAQFQTLTRTRGPDPGEAQATLVGRFFSGREQKAPGGTFWGGYGHLGMFSLLVIEQVVAVELPE